MKKIQSKFDGSCRAPKCLKFDPHISKGEDIYWHKDANGSLVWHAECAEAMARGSMPSNLPPGVIPSATAYGAPHAKPVAATPTPVPAAPVKSCVNCPNLVSPSVASTTWGTPVGGYTCRARGLIVTAPGATPEELDIAGEDLADTCPQFGKTAAALPAHMESRVGVSLAVPKPAATRVAASSCAQCKNYIKPENTITVTGWGIGTCVAQGKLIFPDKMIGEALNCGMSDAGTPQGDITQVKMLSRFEAAIARHQGRTAHGGTLTTTAGLAQIIAHAAQPFPMATTATSESPIPTPVPSRVKLRRKHAVDPREYVTDAPVTPADEANFIRAWRIVEDPEGYGAPIKLPIFNGPLLAASECIAEDHTLCGDHDPRRTYGNHRPDLYVDHSDMLYQFASVMVRHDYVPLLEGPSGTGKTEAMVWWAYLLDLPVVRIAVDKGTEVYHLSGEKELIVDEATGQTITSFKMGRFAAWYGRSCVIVVDEANLKSDVWEFLRPIADGAQRLDLDDAQGISVHRGERTFVAFTQNPSWDPMYVGTEPVSAADIQRVAPFWFDYPDPEVERDIILAHCRSAGYELPPRILDQIMQISGDIRKMQESIGLPWGVRSNIKVAKFSQSFRLPIAYRRAVLDGQESSVVELINQSINSVVK